MLPGYEQFKQELNNKQIVMMNSKFNRIVYNFEILHILKEEQYDQQIISKINESNVIAIDNYSKSYINYFIICFERQLLIVEDCYLHIVQTIFSDENKHKIYFVPKSKSNSLEFEKMKSLYSNNKQHNELFFKQEICNFINYFKIKSRGNQLIITFWQIINKCLSAFLIMKSHVKICKNRINDFIKKDGKKNEVKKFQINEFVKLRDIGSTNTSKIELCYHIESENFMVVKTFYREVDKLEQREFNNYKDINYPFLPTFYGIVSDNGEKSIVIEFINGQTLRDLNKYELTLKEKLMIIIEILFTFQYIHRNGYIYRDLKPNNIMIDNNKQAVLIDFDRMIMNKEYDEFVYSVDFDSPFVECINENSRYSFQNDIYSFITFLLVI